MGIGHSKSEHKMLCGVDPAITGEPSGRTGLSTSLEPAGAARYSHAARGSCTQGTDKRGGTAERTAGCALRPHVGATA
jgi:hypothetical protein